MNIVIITILLPYPLNSGGAQAQYNMIDKLRLKHHFTIIFPENEQNKLKAMTILQERWPEVTFCPYRYIRQLSHLPFLFDKIERAVKSVLIPNNRRFQIERLLKPYGYSINRHFIKFVLKTILDYRADIVQTEFYPYLELVCHLPSSVKKIFIHHELRYVRNTRLLSNFSLTMKDKVFMNSLKENEIAKLNEYDRIVTLTETDKYLLERERVCTPIYVSPAAVGTDSMKYKQWNRKIIFVGGFSHTPNQEGIEWFLNYVVPLIDWTKWSDVELNIIGSGWPKEFERLNLPLKIKCLGFVSNLSDAAYGGIMIVPILSGSGMRMKILDASALGMPLLTTTVGKEGLFFENEQSCLLADSPSDYANSLIRIMSDEVLRQKLTDSAASIFEKEYSVSALSIKREEVYKFKSENE